MRPRRTKSIFNMQGREEGGEAFLLHECLLSHQSQSGHLVLNNPSDGGLICCTYSYVYLAVAESGLFNPPNLGYLIRRASSSISRRPKIRDVQNPKDPRSSAWRTAGHVRRRGEKAIEQQHYFIAGLLNSLLSSVSVPSYFLSFLIFFTITMAMATSLLCSLLCKRRV